MELHRLPTETPTTSTSTSSRGFTDRLYDSCPPCSPRRGGERREESGPAGRPVPAGGLPAWSRGPPRVGPAPAAARVPTLPPGAGGSGSGAWPDHSYCSWARAPGGQGRGAEEGWGDGRVAAGAGPGGGGREGEGRGDREGEMGSPGPARGVQHESALSVYDNLREGATPDDPGTPMETSILFPYSEEDGFLFPYGEEEIRLLTDEAGDASPDSSLWSSCEIILAASRASFGPAPDQPGGPEERASEGPSPLHSGQTGPSDRDRRPPAGADPGPDEGPPVGARAPPPVPLADPAASALRSVLTGLQHQIGRQRDEYEARISSLEQRNEELQSQLLGLRTNLSQQRRWYQAVQAKIQESERARAAAETRNATIQREMDQFFDTFGELNNEARKAERIVRSF